MANFIRTRDPPPAAEIDAIIAGAPVDLIDFQRVVAGISITTYGQLDRVVQRWQTGDRLKLGRIELDE